MHSHHHCARFIQSSKAFRHNHNSPDRQGRLQQCLIGHSTAFFNGIFFTGSRPPCSICDLQTISQRISLWTRAGLQGWHTLLLVNNQIESKSFVIFCKKTNKSLVYACSIIRSCACKILWIKCHFLEVSNLQNYSWSFWPCTHKICLWVEKPSQHLVAHGLAVTYHRIQKHIVIPLDRHNRDRLH